MVATAIALTKIWFDRHAYKSVLSLEITESMSFQPTLAAERDPALRYGAVPERRTIGSKAAQQRHLRQVKIIQASIQQRWQLGNPWTWQLKHMRWFHTQHLKITPVPVSITIGSRLY
ncbi:UNVERIFIED_ORG: hypothetical protein J2X80_003645 [Pseudomonas fluorescens]|nr:hypothetical protein [Pseudomonas fluorescens]